MAKYAVAEMFHSIQGEGFWTGTPMFFVRFVGCSVGKRVCTFCDTDFEHMDKARGGGIYTGEDLAQAAHGQLHLCLTGGEPLDRNLTALFHAVSNTTLIHIETSGTIVPGWLGMRAQMKQIWLTVSPKPGYKREMIDAADELKVILHGLGSTPGWPSLADALRWADAGKRVYIQPRNDTTSINPSRMDEAIAVVLRYPQLRLSCQLHKYLSLR
jgi:7-carboxy-7-deazaguanine synthase